MITAEVFRNNGISPEDEKTPLDIMGDMALSTKEIAIKLSDTLPEGENITYSCAKQKMIRLERKGFVSRRKIKGLIHWLVLQK